MIRQKFPLALGFFFLRLWPIIIITTEKLPFSYEPSTPKKFACGILWLKKPFLLDISKNHIIIPLSLRSLFSMYVMVCQYLVNNELFCFDFEERRKREKETVMKRR